MNKHTIRIALYTLGCKLNQAETEEMKEKLAQAGFFVVPWKNKADIYIVNCCGVTQIAERKTRQIVNQAKKRGRVWITGCIDKKVSGVDHWVKDKEKLIDTLRLPPILSGVAQGIKHYCPNPSTSLGVNFVEGKYPKDRIRTLIKIQDGCDNYCSYCIIPHFRGKPRAVPATKIIREINEKIKQGCKEAILTGVNICKYGKISNLKSQISKPNLKSKIYNANALARLIKRILTKTKIRRLRLGSIDPALVDNKFINLFKNPRLMPHLHLSLQSGSDKVLRTMNRKYTTQQYLILVKKIRKKFPEISFTTDAIVGFPGETEKDFQQTCKLAQQVGFLKIHVFPFSPRPYTAAALMKNQINEKTKEKRVKRLRKISQNLQRKFQRKMLGQKTQVIWEGKKNGWWFGYTENYLRIKRQSKDNLTNKIQTIVIQKNNLSPQ